MIITIHRKGFFNEQFVMTPGKKKRVVYLAEGDNEFRGDQGKNGDKDIYKSIKVLRNWICMFLNKF